MKKKMLFVFNPKAGKGQIKTHLLDVVNTFNQNGYEVLIHATQYPRDAYEKTKEYADKVDMIVCSGGDGTLDEVVTGVMETRKDLPIGYIPAGSTNDFANSLFIPKNMAEAAKVITEENIYQCDIGKFNDSTFAYIAAFGLFTDVAYATDQDLKNILGHVAYLLEGVQRLLDIKKYPMKITSAELETEGDFIFGMITNSRSVGGFKNLTGKNVDMDDGLFEVTLIRMPKNPMELQEILRAIVMQEDNSELIYSFKTKEIKVESEEQIPWTLDGEYGGSPKIVVIENRHKALNLYLRGYENPAVNPLLKE